MKITFCGAAKIVTGSCYLLEVGAEKALVDCGMFQGNKSTTRKNYDPFPFDPQDIKHVFLTHAHIDHSGLLPKLVKHGFKGKIHATSATADLCEVMLSDSGHIQESDTEHENRRRLRQGLEPRKPLYTQEDARACIPLFAKESYGNMIKISDVFSVRYQDAGHILGSAMIEIFVTEGNEKKKLVFSGDIGQWDAPIVEDPTLIEEADYVFMESTYGDRLHEPIGNRDELLLKAIQETYEKGGKLLIPTFAIERTQELLIALKKIIESGKFPKEKIYLDSPLAIKATDIFKRHHECFDDDADTIKNPFSFPELVYTLKAKDSMAINRLSEPAIIMAGSGMCTGGRIRHHLKHGLWDKKNTVLFVGYQAAHTLGRIILDGAEKIWTMGMTIVVKADIRKINSFSAHADYKDLLKWAKGFKNKPKKIFVMHVEPDAAIAFKRRLEENGFKATVPNIHSTVEL